jgi:phage terminase large subunit
MPSVTVNIDPNAFNAVYYPLLFDNSRFELIYGSAGSGKSVFVAQKIIYKHLTEAGHKTLVVRKVGTSIKETVFAELVDVIDSWGLRDLVFKVPTGKAGKYDIEGQFGNRIIFSGLDNVDKLKSIKGITDIWVEEADQITQKEFQQLDARIRGFKSVPKQIIMTLNPINIKHWIKKYFIDEGNRKSETVKLRTTYLDNKFLTEEDRNTLESYKDVDPYFYMVYTQGEWGQLDNIIFTNWKETSFNYREQDYDMVCNGVDFGFNDPNVLVRVGIKDEDVYVFDEYYNNKITGEEFMKIIKQKVPQNQMVICDSHRPDTIKEFQRNNINAVATSGGHGSILEGINWLRQRHIYISPNCENVIREFTTYKWKTDKNDEPIDEPIDKFNHTIDAIRYAVEKYRLHIKAKRKRIKIGSGRRIVQRGVRR